MKETGSSLENLELYFDTVYDSICFFLCKTFLHPCMLWVKILAFCPEHGVSESHIHQLLPLSKTTSIPVSLSYGSPPLKLLWSEVFFQETIVSEEHLLSSPLWQNSLIRIQNKPVFYKDWLVKGITQVKHLMDESSNFFSLAAFQIKYNLQVRPLTFFGLISAVNRLRRQNTTSIPVSLSYGSPPLKLLDKKPL